MRTRPRAAASRASSASAIRRAGCTCPPRRSMYPEAASFRSRSTCASPRFPNRGDTMSDHVYKHIELTGSSPTSIEEAVSNAIAKASETVRNIHWFNVVETRGYVSDAKVAYWQVTVKVGFTLE